VKLPDFMSRMRSTPRIAALSLLLLALGGATLFAAFQGSRPATAPAPLAAFAPPGALLAIESPDFGSLLHAWTGSSEQRRWLAGDNYADFSRSRLFERLGQAQSEFATTAGLAPDAKFLEQIAGRQSLLAWYDIGNLEFLYITHLQPGAATPLLQLRQRFEQRTVGPDTFYVRTQTDPARTVAFAVRGEYLLLATREDLLAGALQRMQRPADRSLLHDPWYAQSIATAPAQPGDLRMTLHLASLVPSPYFRSYWIQQNITELKQYSAAISDLYRTTGNLREARVLLPEISANPAVGEDLSPVLAYLPAHTGVYRATAYPAEQAILKQLEEKLLAPTPVAEHGPGTAPVADLSTPATGDASDLEQRIDAPLIVPPTRASELAPLRDLLHTLKPTAMLVFSTASAPEKTLPVVFTQLHSAVVLAASSPWSVPALQQGLDAALAPRITVGQMGLTWSPHHDAALTWYTLDGPKSLALAVNGKLCILATDETTLRQLLAAAPSADAAPRIAVTIAGFDLPSERAPFTHLTALLDQPGAPAQSGNGNPPQFFSGNLNSLGFTFSDLASETFTETSAADHAVHQSVVYQWQH
jgi:hypothetical protein